VAEHRDDATAKAERLDRELIELLNELRVMLPGVQALFAFLFIVPFSERFSSTTRSERVAYYIAFAAAALCSILFIAPSVYHRVQFRQHDKEELLRVSNGLVIAGTVVLGIGIAASIYVVTGFLVDDVLALIASLAAFLLLSALWWGLPLSRRLTRSRRA
jgi:hypothetical protein